MQRLSKSDNNPSILCFLNICNFLIRILLFNIYKGNGHSRNWLIPLMTKKVKISKRNKRSKPVIIIIIVFDIELSFHRPFIKLTKRNHTSMIKINALERLFWIVNGNAPFLHHGNRIYEFLFADSSIHCDIDSTKRHPVFIIVSDVLEKVWELGFWNLVLSVFGSGLELIFGVLKSFFDHNVKAEWWG